MFTERTSVGLDVHARSVVGCAIDDETGEIHHRRLSPDPVEITAWIKSLPQPWAATYEAGPTGFGLSRFLRSRGVGMPAKGRVGWVDGRGLSTMSHGALEEWPVEY